MMEDIEYMEITFDVPKSLVEDIWTFNGNYPGPKGHTINLTQTCIDALRAALKKGNKAVAKEGEALTGIQDDTGVEIRVGDRVSYVISAPDAHETWGGIVALVEGEYIITGMPFQFRLDDTELLELKVVRLCQE